MTTKEITLTEVESQNLRADHIVRTVWSMLHDASTALQGAAQIWEERVKTPEARAKARVANRIAATILSGRITDTMRTLADDATQTKIVNEVTRLSARNELLDLLKIIESEHIAMKQEKGLASHADLYLQ